MNYDKKVKIYLDTSVFSYLKQDDSPEKTKSTNDFWELLKKRQNEDVEIYISTVTVKEINDCFEPKRSFMLSKLTEIQFTLLEVNDRNESMAKQIINLGILTDKSKDDCLHISSAVFAECDYIASWNFKHLVNVKTINGVRAITNLKGYKQIDIITPEMFIEGGVQ